MHGARMTDADEETIEATETGKLELEQLVAQLLGEQDAERRRIAGELHDTTAQHLAAVLIGLDRALSARQAGMASLMEQTRGLVHQSLREIRALCYRLHPPMLEELGLRPALGWLVKGVEQNGPMAVFLEMPSDLGRWPLDVETGIFRLIQAELASLCTRVGVERTELALTRAPRGLALSIAACGPGARVAFDAHDEPQADAGIGAVRARVHQLGGNLRIDAGETATRMLISVPSPGAQPASGERLPRAS